MPIRPRLLLILFQICLISSVASAQNSNTLTQQDRQTKQREFDEFESEFRRVVIEVYQLNVKYQHAPSIAAAEPVLNAYEEKVKQGNAILEKWIPVGVDLFEDTTNRSVKPDNELEMFMAKVMAKWFDDGNYQQSYRLANELLTNNPENEFAKIYWARAGVLTNRFGPKIVSAIKQSKDFFQREDAVSDVEEILINNIHQLESDFQEELAIRAQEIQSDDLPQVLFETSKGKFVIELFENEAPETVANFISLVESGHYDGLIFNTVIDKAAAETGTYDQDLKVREIGYAIVDEHHKPDIRKNFAGSVVMYSSRPDTAGSRFFVSMSALPAVNGRQTVFGRVKTGIETVYCLNKTFNIEEQRQIEIDDVTPDTVVSAVVLRKRAHQYQPNKVVPK